MTRKTKIIMIFIAFISILFVACNNNQQSVNEDSVNKVYDHTEGKLIEKITNELAHENSIEQINISEILFYDSEAFAVFSFNEKGSLHEGIAYSSIIEDEWEIIEIDTAVVDTEVPFTKHNLAVVSKGEVARHFIITAGYINDKTIDEIRMTYDNNTEKIIKLGPDQTLYLDYEVGNETYVQELIGLNKKGDTVFEYPL